MATAKEPAAETKATSSGVKVVDSDGNDVEMVVIDDVRYRADDPAVKKLREKAGNKSRDGGTTK